MPKTALALSCLVFIFGLITHHGVRSQQCPEPNGLFAIADHCDRYFECRNGTMRDHLCPDGLLFNHRFTHFRYPCDYPSEVDCTGRPNIQPAQPTTNCPHRWGMFPDSNPNNCGVFWNCVDGRSFKFECPEGLAFSTITSRCEYPDEAPNCNAEAFLGFRCPTPDPQIFQQFLGHPRYPHFQDCKKFFVCVDGHRPRLNTCPNKRVFNGNTASCDDPINVPGCEATYDDPVLDVRTNTAQLKRSTPTTN
ncbi:cuticular protein analogous to peritrophins 3-E [Chamberlinius hualienensis]